MRLQELKESKNVTSEELEYYVNEANWPTDLEAAKEFAKEAVLKWQWNEKKPRFIAKIDRARTVKQVQELLIYPLLSGEGMGVIK